MNSSEDVTIKNLIKIYSQWQKILNLRYLDLIWIVCIFYINYSNNREIKINLAHLHVFILQCFPNYKNRVILVDLSAIFGVSTVNFSPFQGPNRSDALLPHSGKTFQYHNEYRMLFLRKNNGSYAKLKLSANSLPIRHLPIRPAETVCQFELKFSSGN